VKKHLRSGGVLFVYLILRHTQKPPAQQPQAFEDQTRSSGRMAGITGVGARPQQAVCAFVGTKALLARQKNVTSRLMMTKLVITI